MMHIFGFDVSISRIGKKRTLENPSFSLSDPRAFELLFGEVYATDSGITVTVDKALGVPAIWAAVQFLSSTVAALPLQVFRRLDAGSEKDSRNPLSSMLHDAPNPQTTSYKWRKSLMADILLHGRSYTFIERNAAGRVLNLWGLDPTKMSVLRIDGDIIYRYDDGRQKNTYKSGEIIDLPWMLAADGITHHDPIARLRNAIGLAIALEGYASQFFQRGGVPPLQLIGPFQSPAGARRAGDDITAALTAARDQRKNILPLPLGHELKQIGFNPEEGQMEMARRMQVEEVARIYGLPPVFLQDLTRATFSNAEQQDLHLVKHVITQWIQQIEQELNLKLFSSRNRWAFVKFNVDGLLRGDFKSRMEAHSASIQNAIRTPNEVREIEDLEPKAEGDKLLIQGATVELGSQPPPAIQAEPPPTTPPEPQASDEESSDAETAS